MSEAFNESTVEEAVLFWFADLGYEVRHGEQIAPKKLVRSGHPMAMLCWSGD